MIKNQYPGYLYNYINVHPLLLVMLCFSLISCAPPKINSQDEIKQIQSEQKPMVDHEQKHITGDKPDQQGTSSAVKNET